MADQSDIETALTQLAAAALYPNGAAATSSIGATIRLFRGWPNTAALDADLAAGRVNISVFPAPGSTHPTTRYAPGWQPSPVTPSLTVSTAGPAATFAGVAGIGQLAGILVDGQSYVHRTVANDTPGLVAAVLATAISVDRPALATGATVTVPDAISLVARTAADAAALLETRSQRQAFRITAWCPTPALRDAACTTLDAAFAATPFLALPNGIQCRLRYAATTTFDQKEDAALFRRDLLYQVEYPTTQAATQPSMLFGTTGLGATTITA